MRAEVTPVYVARDARNVIIDVTMDVTLAIRG